MNELHEMIRIADVHAARIKMALEELQPIMPFDARKMLSLTKEELLLSDLLIHRFGKLQDLLGNNIIDEFLKFTDEYSQNLSMLDKIHKLERLEIIEDAELWKDMRKVRNHITHEYPDHPEFTAADLNKVIDLVSCLLQIVENIKNRIDYKSTNSSIL